MSVQFRLVRILAAVSLGLSLCGSTSSAAVLGEADVNGLLVGVGLTIEQQIEVARHNADRGTVDQEALNRQAEEAAEALKGLEQAIAGLSGEAHERMQRKFESVAAQAENLARAARLASAPPRRIPAGTRPQRFDHGGPGRSAPTNDDCSGGFVVDVGTYAGDTTEATNDGQAVCGSSLFSPDVWYRFVPSETARYVAETTGSSYDTVLSVHSGCPGTAGNTLECDDDTVGLQSQVSFQGYLGSEYLIRVAGSNGATGQYVLRIYKSGAIAGRVSREMTGASIAVRVTAYDNSGYSVDYDYSSGSTGAYQVDGLVEGNYFVVAKPYLSSSDDVGELYDDYLCPNGPPTGCDVTTGTPVPVTANQITGSIDFALATYGAISGTVVDGSSGDPIAAAYVRAYRSDGSYEGYDYTDADGSYLIEGLIDTSSYYVEAISSNHTDELYNDVLCEGGIGEGCVLGDGTPVDVALDTVTSGIDFMLDRSAGMIEGTVTDQVTGSPLSSAEVTIYDDAGNYVGYDYTDAYGVYQYSALPDGDYYLVASRSTTYAAQVYDGLNCATSDCDVLAGTPVTINNHASVSGIDFSLVYKGSISGTIVDATTGSPVPYVRVWAYDGHSTAVRYDDTDANGFFVITALYSGTYFVVTYSSAHQDELYDDIPCEDTCNPVTGTPVSVVIGQTTSGVDFSLVAKGSITGTVSAAGTSAPVLKRVRLYTSSGSSVTYEYSNDGVFEFTGLDDGDYFVATDTYSSSDEYLDGLYLGLPCWGGAPEGCDVTEGTPVTVTADSMTSGIDLVLQKGGSIGGSVVDAVDGGAVSSYVYAVSLSGQGTFYGYTNAGTYEFHGLIPGDYMIVADAYDHIDEIWENIQCAGEYPDACDTSGATPITLGENSSAIVDFTLDRLGSVSGTVTASADGSPLDNFRVAAYDSEGQFLVSTYSNFEGHYLLENIYPSTVYVVTDRHDINYVDQLFDGIDCYHGPPTGCDPTTGAPVAVAANTDTQGVDFSLNGTGSIEGQVVDGVSLLPLSGVLVRVYGDDGTQLQSGSTDNGGFYRIGDLPSGEFFVATDEYYLSSDYLDVLYDGVPCPTGPPNGCDPVKGTPVPVATGVATRFVDFHLPRLESGITGAITDSSTGSPIPGVLVDVWRTDTGAHVTSVLTSPSGTYLADLEPGTYVAATDNPGGWINEIYANIACPGGSAYGGECDPMAGTEFTVTSGELTPDIDFSLVPATILFGDDFESGDTTGWDTTVP